MHKELLPRRQGGFLLNEVVGQDPATAGEVNLEENIPLEPRGYSRIWKWSR